MITLSWLTRRAGSVSVGLLLLAATAVWADAATDEARRLLAVRQAPAAFALLSPLEPQRAGDPEFDYLLGIAAIDAGQPTRAIFALERVLALQPDNALARAEIARAYLAVGETDTAKAEFNALRQRQGAVPQAAVADIERYLDAISQIEATRTLRLRAYVEAVLGHDSNINSATSSGQVAVPALGGLVVALNPAGVRRDDRYATLGAGLSLRAPVRPDLAFVASASAHRLSPGSEGDFDTTTFDLSAGLAYTQGRDLWGLALQANRFRLDGGAFRNVTGLLAQWQHNLDASSQVTVFGQFGRLDYPSQSIRDANRFVLGAGYARAFGRDAPVGYASLYAGRENERAAGLPHLGHTLVGLRFGLNWRLAPAVTTFADASLERRRHGGPEPFFLTTRVDHQQSLSVGLHWVPAKDWRLTPQVALTHNGSNVALFRFNRAVASLALRREF